MRNRYCHFGLALLAAAACVGCGGGVANPTTYPVTGAVLYKGPVEDKHFEDVEVTALFWWFANVVWVPFAALFYLDGMVR